MEHAVKEWRERVPIFFKYPSQTSVDKGFFRLASRTVGFSLRFKNSGLVIKFSPRCGLQINVHVKPF